MLRSKQIKKIATNEQVIDINKSKNALERQSKKIADKFQKYFELKLQLCNGEISPRQIED